MSRPLPARIRAVPAITLLLAAVPLSAQSPGTVYRVPVTGVVELGLAPFIERSIEEAAAAGMEFVVLDMDTPGGRVDAAEPVLEEFRTLWGELCQKAGCVGLEIETLRQELTERWVVSESFTDKLIEGLARAGLPEATSRAESR